MNTLIVPNQNPESSCMTVCTQEFGGTKTKTRGKKPAKRQPYAVITGDYRKVAIRRVKNRGSYIFQVAGPRTSTKPRGRRSFANEENARKFAQILADLPRKCTSTLTEIPVDRLESISCAIGKLEPILLPLNISIASGIEEYAALKSQAGRQDLRELFGVILNKPWVQKSKTPFPIVLEHFLSSRKDKARVRPEYHRTLYYTLGRVAELVGNTPIGEVSLSHLESFVFDPKRAKRSNKTYRTNIRTFFRWCQLQEYLDYGSPTVADRLEKIRADDINPKIATVAEAKQMLAGIDDKFCLLFLAISLFTGIRHDEVLRLDWGSVQPGKLITVNPEDEKRGKRRIIPIQPNLDAWLRPFYGRCGLIMPPAWVQMKTRLLAQKLLIKWKRNWLRHSYASYRLSQTGSVVQTAQEDGHDAYILERHYLHLVTNEEALAFFSLTPEACGITDWNAQVTAFLKDKPEIFERTKRKSRGWKKIINSPGDIAIQENIIKLAESKDQAA